MSAPSPVHSILLLALSYGFTTISGQVPPPNGAVPLHAVQHFGSDALIGNGISPVVMENNSFLAQLVGGSQLQTVVHRISLDGSSDTKFDVAAIRRPLELGDRTPYVWAFCSDSRGDVYVLTRWMKNRVSDINNILAFDSHGVLERIIPVPADNIQVLHMAHFRNGNFVLLAGRNGDLGFRSIKLIISSDDGRILAEKPLRELSSSEEELARVQAMHEAEVFRAQNMGNQESVNSSTAGSPEKNKDANPVDTLKASENKHPGRDMDLLFYQTLLASSEDGTVYLVRPDKPGLIYRVTNTGNITDIPMMSDERDGRGTTGYTELTNGVVSGGQLVLFYSKMDSAPSQYKSRHLLGFLIKTYDLLHGNLTGIYSGNSDMLGSSPAGWNGDGPSYLKYVRTAQPPGFEIVSASP